MAVQAIQLGETIPGTDLVKRWEKRQEVAPIYIGDLRASPDPLEVALQQALQAGYRSVVVVGSLYVHLGGSWYVWSFPPRWRPERVEAR